LLAAVGTLLNETSALEHGNVLLHGGEAHLVPRSKIGHRVSDLARMSRRVPSAKARNSWLSASSQGVFAGLTVRALKTALD
jgi:hypothetical protein